MASNRIFNVLLVWQLLTTSVHSSAIPPQCRTSPDVLHQSDSLESHLSICPDHAFDYVIVGGGNAGLTLAVRLTEDPDTRVAVIEAGGFYEEVTGNQSQIPANDWMFSSKWVDDSRRMTDWLFETTPQEGANGESMPYHRGKTLGGSTALNYMAYQRTTVGAMEKWADEVGDESWKFESILQYYEKAANFTPPDMDKRMANATPDYDITTLQGGSSPYLDLTYPNYAQPFSTWVSKALEAVGVLPTNGFTSGHLNGSSWILNTINQTTGFRETSETAFLSPNLDRPNLVLFKNTLAEKIIFNDDKSAEGVWASQEDDRIVLVADKEVILSAGAFQSPQLLLVSGIGPAEILQEHGIDVVVDSPGVGQNLQDNPIFGIGYRVDVVTTSALHDTDKLMQAIKEFNSDVAGPLSSPGGDFAAFEGVPDDLRASFSSSTLDDLNSLPDDWPELEYFALPAYVGDQENPQRDAPHDGHNYATLMVTLMAPFSKGNLSISSANMKEQPVINPNWLTSKTDIEVAVAGFKRLRQILETSVMEKNIAIGQEYYPGRRVVTDEEIHESIKKIFYTMSHASSTCKMGRSDNRHAVVDSAGKVYGTKKLRVVDASIFPFLPPGLPMATVYMLAEKIADEIKKEGRGAALGKSVPFYEE